MGDPNTTIRKPWWAWAAQISLLPTFLILVWQALGLWEHRNG